MCSRLVAVLLAVCALCTCIDSAALAQSVGSRNSNWLPYRNLQSDDSSRRLESQQADEPIVKPTQYIDCEPCPPECTEVVTNGGMVPMSRSAGTYIPVGAPQPIFVEPPTGTPFLTTQMQSPNWGWEILPSDVIWHSYWAGTKESRMSGTFYEDVHNNITNLDVTLGGRAAIARYGTRINGQPYGWELQIEGAGQPRLNLDQNWDLDAADFRFGVPLIYGEENIQFKFSYYHLSSHLGDEYIEREGFNPANRVNYARDELVIGASIFPLPAWRWYAEVGWAFYADQGAEPWEFQFGLDYAQPGPTGAMGTPFFAINGHLREEVDFGGALSAQAGWLWRGNTGRVIRTGVHYFNGKSNQFAFSGPLEQFEQQIGAGLWYDY